MPGNDKSVKPDLVMTLARLEESLWRSETRFDNDYMESVLAPDFFEFGRSGKRYKRAEMFIGDESTSAIEAKLPLSNFNARYLADNVVQTTYISEVVHDDAVQYANRSSIWTRQSDRWRLQFHQGTPTDVD